MIRCTWKQEFILGLECFRDSHGSAAGGAIETFVDKVRVEDGYDGSGLRGKSEEMLEERMMKQ